MEHTSFILPVAASAAAAFTSAALWIRQEYTSYAGSIIIFRYPVRVVPWWDYNMNIMASYRATFSTACTAAPAWLSFSSLLPLPFQPSFYTFFIPYFFFRFVSFYYRISKKKKERISIYVYSILYTYTYVYYTRIYRISKKITVFNAITITVYIYSIFIGDVNWKIRKSNSYQFFDLLYRCSKNNHNKKSK